MADAQAIINALRCLGHNAESYAVCERQCVSVELCSYEELWRLARGLGRINAEIPEPCIIGISFGFLAYWPDTEWPS